MLSALSDQDREERDAIVANIYAAFANVTRGEHGISWNECVALDNYEPEVICEAARRSDTDDHWSELIDDSNWQPFPGIGGFPFINCNGFRYYLPPTMIRLLNGENTEWYPGHLLGVIERFMKLHLAPLSDRQLRCVARFISFMAQHDDNPKSWLEAMDRRWHAYLRI